MQHGTITWQENAGGEGVAILEWDNGGRDVEPLAEPITASTDSHQVAGLFGYDFASVEHDDDTIHVAMAEEKAVG